MSELFTYGSVGGAGGNPGSYPEKHLVSESLRKSLQQSEH
jgi:hypothetical protein